jgi:hypothetical protein
VWGGGHLWFGVKFHSHKYGILSSQNQVVTFFSTGENQEDFFGRNRNSQFVNRVTKETKGLTPRRALTLTFKGKRPIR